MNENQPFTGTAVTVKNWHEMPQPKTERSQPKKTTPRTVILDPTGATGQKNFEVCSYEEHRFRLIIQVIDAPCTLMTESPVQSPDPNSTIAAAPQGRYLPNSLSKEYVFYGPDAFWLNSLTGNPTRVTITKEYK